MIKKLARLALATTAIVASLNSHAGVIGTLSWDGVSNTFSSSEDPSVSYVQFGLTKNKSYSDILSLLSSTFSGYHLATENEAYTFMNRMVIGSDPFPANFSTTISPFADDALGETEGAGWDFYIFGGPTDFGLINTEGPNGLIQIMGTTWAESNVSGWSIGNGTGWLLVSNAATAATTAVPEPSTYAMMGLGLLGLLGISRRRQKFMY